MKLEHDFEVLLKTLDISSNQESAKECPFTFLRMACGIFDEETNTPSHETFFNTQRCVGLLADFCNPKELIVALTEELSRESDFVSLQKVECLLPTFHKSLEAINQQKFVNLVFNTICNFLERTLDVDSNPLEKESRTKANLEKQLTYTLDLLVSSFSHFADKTIANLKEDESAVLKLEAEELSIILLRLMSHPFSLIPSVLINDEDYSNSSQSKCLKLFADLQSDLIKFQNNLLSLQQQRQRKYDIYMRLQHMKRANKTSNCQLGAGESLDESLDDEDTFPDSPFSWEMEAGFVTLSHFVFNDHHYLGRLVPQVYTHQHLFKWHLQLIHSATSSKCFSTDKSISLLSSLLKRLGTGHLKQDFLDFEHFKPVVEMILAEVTSPSCKNTGRRSLDCLNMTIWAFNPQARLDFFSYLLFKNDHPGFLGFLITAIKSQMDESLNNKDGVFNDDVITNFSKYIFTLDLPKEIVSASQVKRRKLNIHENMDRYMASLNFLRFLVIRYARAKEAEGGEGCEFNISTILPDVEKKFLEPLKVELSKSRSGLLEDVALMRGELEAPKAEVTVGGDVFGALKPEEELKMSQVMLVKLDLIESILSRVEILISNQRNHKDPISEPPTTLPQT